MTHTKLLPRVGVILVLIIAFASCQEDISTIGSEILGSEPPSGVLDESQKIIAYSKKLSPVQSNRLPAYQLGVYADPVYGKTSVSLLTQLKMPENNPEFGENATADSVFVYIPYYSESTTVDSTTTYTTDSIYGGSPINITISESNYFLRDLDPEGDFQDPQPYYSNQGPLFRSNLGSELVVAENFIPTSNGFVFNKGEDNEEKLGPGLRVALPTTFFQEKIIDKEGSQELRNNNNFKNYLRGLHFQVEDINNNGNLFVFDATKAYVIIYYSHDDEDEPEERVNKTFKLNFGDVTVNTFENDPLPQFIQSDLDNPNIVTGNDNLYLRGGDGIISVVELFGNDSDDNGVPDDLELLRAKKWLVNEANLIFYVNQDLMTGGNNEPERIMIYDLKNSSLLADYFLDPTSGLPPVEAMTTHFGRLERGSDNAGQYYKLRITNHISNLINKDSTNVPLGVVVTQNVLNRTNQKLLETTDPSIEKVPTGTVISHEGTILHGNSSPNPEKRLKLQIYYTKQE